MPSIQFTNIYPPNELRSIIEVIEKDLKGLSVNPNRRLSATAREFIHHRYKCYLSRAQRIETHTELFTVGHPHLHFDEDGQSIECLILKYKLGGLNGYDVYWVAIPVSWLSDYDLYRSNYVVSQELREGRHFHNPEPIKLESLCDEITGTIPSRPR